MQKWTKKKPDAVGHWWALDPDLEVARVCERVLIDSGPHSVIPAELYCDYDEDYISLSSRMFSNWLWGSSKLTEPAGEKI